MQNTDDKIIQKAILVGVGTSKNIYDIDKSMDELKELANAAGAEVLYSIVQNKEKIEATYYIGKGKVEEVKMFADNLEANTVIFNNELSGSQIRNLEDALDLKVIDRTALILDIFATRAKTRDAKLQVELAQLRYRLPRLVGINSSMSRLGAGIGTRGPGEQKLELDRRKIKEKITDIKNELKEIKKQRETQRSKRVKNRIPIVALVGYTNAGKSTIMNRVLQKYMGDNEDKQVFEKDMLFATLDTYHRKVELPDNKSFILIDTIGFVSELPHSLVEAFKATLEEIREADYLIHVVDSSDAHLDMQVKVTRDVLDEFGIKDIPYTVCYNKVDLVEDEDFLNRSTGLYISALEESDIEKLVEDIKGNIFNDYIKCKFLIPYDQGQIVNNLMKNFTILNTEHTGEGTLIEVEVDEENYNRYNKYIVE